MNRLAVFTIFVACPVFASGSSAPALAPAELAKEVSGTFELAATKTPDHCALALGTRLDIRATETPMLVVESLEGSATPLKLAFEIRPVEAKTDVYTHEDALTGGTTTVKNKTRKGVDGRSFVDHFEARTTSTGSIPSFGSKTVSKHTLSLLKAGLIEFRLESSDPQYSYSDPKKRISCQYRESIF